MTGGKKLSKTRRISRSSMSASFLLKERWKTSSERMLAAVEMVSSFLNEQAIKAATFIGLGKLFDSPYTEEMVVQQTRVLCRDYIFTKLRENSLLKHDIYPPGLEVDDVVRACQPKGHDMTCGACDVSRELVTITQEFDRMYPYLFKDICTYLHVNFQTGAQLQTVFTAVAAELFRRSITWARVVALFAFTGALVVECVEQGHVNYANIVVDSMQKFTRRRLAAWVVKQGGWPAMVHHVQSYRVSSSRLWFLSIIGAAVGITLTLGLP
ncbi:bcl-2-related ovarian killer protein homolog B-like [Acanthaster planci]|uniref:Bcl-2-related ovarian killer protein homolog B-like n=1 Tax=Acanthaster planci TaxID=133434 RepID=A0A8B7YPQ0_ACAPL|nr:bcl-2-related ovarian killer protein homolog B-like [Acanthaster planci]